jgi:hypothetical protein
VKEGPYLLERKKRIQLDQAVQVAKDDRHRQEHEVTRIPAEEANQFHHFGKTKHERDFRPK